MDRSGKERKTSRSERRSWQRRIECQGKVNQSKTNTAEKHSLKVYNEGQTKHTLCPDTERASSDTSTHTQTQTFTI